MYQNIIGVNFYITSTKKKTHKDVRYIQGVNTKLMENIYKE